MLEDIVNGGTLEMSSTPFQIPAGAWEWGNCLVNRIAVLFSVVCFFMVIKDLTALMPSLLAAVDRTKANISLEHSLGMARLRRRVSIVMALPFCLLIDRFGLYTPDFLGFVPRDYMFFAIFSIILLYVFVRLVFFWVFRPKRSNQDTAMAFHHAPFNYFILLVAIMLLTACAMEVCKCPDENIRMVLWIETGFVWLFSLLRQTQILKSDYRFFGTFLYLCTLEFIPTGILIASAIVL